MSMSGTRLALTALSLIGLIVAILVAIYYASDGFVYDAHAYWLSDGYGRASQETDAFSYSPPILLLFQAIRAVMPWEVFAYVYSISIALGIWVLAGPFTLFVVFTPHVATEISLGNIHIFLALVTVFGLRWPWLWSFVLLTKVTPGVGLVWFVVRREWRSLWIALGVTALIALPTVVLYPQLWADWIRVVTEAGPGAGSLLALRVGLGAAIVGGRSVAQLAVARPDRLDAGSADPVEPPRALDARRRAVVRAEAAAVYRGAADSRRRPSHATTGTSMNGMTRPE